MFIHCTSKAIVIIWSLIKFTYTLILYISVDNLGMVSLGQSDDRVRWFTIEAYDSIMKITVIHHISSLECLIDEPLQIGAAVVATIHWNQHRLNEHMTLICKVAVTWYIFGLLYTAENEIIALANSLSSQYRQQSITVVHTCLSTYNATYCINFKYNILHDYCHPILE